MKYLLTDIKREGWQYYHKFILHRGRYGMREWLTCRHINPYYVLTPRLFKKQIKNIS